MVSYFNNRQSFTLMLSRKYLNYDFKVELKRYDLFMMN